MAFNRLRGPLSNREKAGERDWPLLRQCFVGGKRGAEL